MTVRQLLVIGPFALSLLALPCQAGPCSKDIERIQVLIDAKLNAIAAAGPTADQSYRSTDASPADPPFDGAGREQTRRVVAEHIIEKVKAR